MADATEEIESGNRFGFGENWARFLDLVDETRIQAAVASLGSFLESDDLSGKTFVDVGSGSGLFSLAARFMGADVVSFDFDPQSVACTQELRRRYCDGDECWRIEQGSVLDGEFVDSLGTFDVVYSWGVLHHTGDMYGALAAVSNMVAERGQLFIALYNDQGRTSRNWKRVKQAYNQSGAAGKRVVLASARAHLWWSEIDVAGSIYRGVKRLPSPKTENRGRGMDKERDLIDWVGGWPFEVSTPDEIFDYFRGRGFELSKMQTCGGGLGCNQFVFGRTRAV